MPTIEPMATYRAATRADWVADMPNFTTRVDSRDTGWWSCLTKIGPHSSEWIPRRLSTIWPVTIAPVKPARTMRSVQ